MLKLPFLINVLERFLEIWLLI